MQGRQPTDDAADRALSYFREMVESVGVKRFADSLGISTRQVNRILAGVQPNPVNRMLKSLQASHVDAGDRALDYICQEMGGYFVREDGGIDDASVNAVKECAEAIAAISDGQITEVAEREIREAVSALICLSRLVQERRINPSDENGAVRLEVHAQRINLNAAARPRLRLDR